MAENVQGRTSGSSDVSPAGEAAAFRLKQAMQVAESSGYGREPAIVAAVLQAISAGAQIDAIERAAARLEKALTKGQTSSTLPA